LAARRAAISGSCADLLQGAVSRANTVNSAFFDALATAVLPNVYALEAGATVSIGAAQSVVSAHGGGSSAKDTVFTDRRGAGTHRVDARDGGAHELAGTLVGVVKVSVDVVALAKIDSRPAAVIIPMTGLVDAEAEAPRGNAGMTDVALRTVEGVVTRRAMVLAYT
jgi:hypothetical protein